MQRLEQRLLKINAEIRHYPGPIASCDEQLAGLLDERWRLTNALANTAQQGGCSPSARWINDGGFDAA
jgi:chorismate mutase